MAQVKKREIYDAIVSSAQALFRDKGYNNTTVAEVARSAGVSTSNIYVYFPSKLQILYALCDPWLRQRIKRLAKDVDRLDDPEDRLRLIFRTLWQDIPADKNGFANNLMQALSSTQPEDTYSRDLLVWAEREVTRLIRESMPADRAALVDGTYLAHIVFMAFDGFAINYRLNGPSERFNGIVKLMVTLLLGNSVCDPPNGVGAEGAKRLVPFKRQSDRPKAES